jgi:hypothetical protein
MCLANRIRRGRGQRGHRKPHRQVEDVPSTTERQLVPPAVHDVPNL